MIETTSRPRWEQQINNGVRWALRHWLLMMNSIVFLYGGLPWLSPIAHVLGLHWLGSAIFLVYSRLCHQKPGQSFFLNGYQVAFCERETAMYTCLFVGGLLFHLVRTRVRPARLWVGTLLLLPMLLDGGSQLIDDLFHTSLRGANDTIGSFNFWTRMITGLLFAIAALITVYPRLQRDLRDIDIA